MAKAGLLSSDPQDEPLSDIEDSESQPWEEERRQADARIKSAGKGPNSTSEAAGTILILSPMRDRGHALSRFFGLISQ